MTPPTKSIGFLVMVASLLIAATGCETVHKYSFTYRLWDTEDLRKWSEPAPDPKLALFQDPVAPDRDVLVEYDALSERRSAVKRQAYYLYRNQAGVASGKKPKLLNPASEKDLKPLPLFVRPGDTNLPGQATYYAVASPDGRKFTLHPASSPEQTFELPVYPETSGTTVRVVLTPLAVAGDTLMVGGVAAVVGFVLWLQSGAPTANVH